MIQYAKLVNSDGTTAPSARIVKGLEVPKNFGYTFRYCAPEVTNYKKTYFEIFKTQLRIDFDDSHAIF